MSEATNSGSYFKPVSCHNSSKPDTGNRGGYNLLNVSDEIYNEAQALKAAGGSGFFTNVNAKWIDEAVKRGDDIIIVSDLKHMFNDKGDLSGFGKEIKYLIEVHG